MIWSRTSNAPWADRRLPAPVRQRSSSPSVHWVDFCACTECRMLPVDSDLFDMAWCLAEADWVRDFARACRRGRTEATARLRVLLAGTAAQQRAMPRSRR